jgi:hypothetical protein
MIGRYFLRFPKRRYGTAAKRPYNLRGKLIRKYGKCILTGWTSPLEFQAAHIVPRHVGYALNFPEVNHSTNCILLSNSLHSIFDDMVWSFDMMNINPIPMNDENFKTKLVIRDNYPITDSILSLIHRKNIVVPSVYIPSLYLHYMVFMDLQTDTGKHKSLTELYRTHIESDTYKDIRGLKAEEYIEYLQKNC